MRIFSWVAIHGYDFEADGYVIADSKREAEEKIKILQSRYPNCTVMLDEDNGEYGTNMSLDGIGVRWEN